MDDGWARDTLLEHTSCQAARWLSHLDDDGARRGPARRLPAQSQRNIVESAGVSGRKPGYLLDPR